MKTLVLMIIFLTSFQIVHADSTVISLTTGESKLIKVRSADQSSIDDPSIASFNSLSDSEILLSGKSSGKTTLSYTSTTGEKIEATVNVSSHLSKKPMIEVGVEIMEIDSQSALQAGLSWGSVSNAGGASTTISNSVAIGEGAPPSLLALGSFSRDSLVASVQLLLNRGKAKILSKPKLLTISGEEASFLAGGEIPYATENKVGATNVEWKPYGVKLKIKPTIDSSENIETNLRAEVSEIDNSNGIQSNGIVIPALKTRWAETSVFMKSGNTLVIAGLIEEISQKNTSGLPLISDIPILGELFRSTTDQKSQTELVIFVTPTLIGNTNN